MLSEQRTDRYIDALIAVKVMGWVRDGGFLVPPKGTPMRDNNWAAEWDEDGRPHWLPKYSTSIANAWEVVEKMASDDDEFRLTRNRRGRWLCTFKFFDGLSEGAETAPMAICLAALAVFGVDPAGKGEK